MYQLEDRVVYGIHGVCRVAALEERVIDRKRVTYLVLTPEGQDGSRFLVPTHNAAAMAKLRPVLSRQALEDMLRSETVRADGWIPEENQRKQTYRDLISSGDREKLMQMVRTLYRHKAAQTAAGRKCHLCDDNFLHDAERLLASEVSIVLGLELEDAKKYLKKQLSE